MTPVAPQNIQTSRKMELPGPQPLSGARNNQSAVTITHNKFTNVLTWLLKIAHCSNKAAVTVKCKQITAKELKLGTLRNEGGQTVTS